MAKLAQPMISTVYSTILIKILNKQNIDVEHFLSEISLNPESLKGPDTMIPMATFQMMMEEAARYTGDENIGLHYYENLNLSDLGVLGYALINSRDIRHAISIITRYYSLFQSDSEIQLSIIGDQAHHSYIFTSKKILPTRQDSEMTMMAFITTVSSLLGKAWRPNEVHFVHAKPQDTSEHQRLLGDKILFSQPVNTVIFYKALLDETVPNSDLNLSQSLEATFGQLLNFQLAPSEDDWLQSLQNQIVESINHNKITINEVAKSLNMSSRTLQRRLDKYNLNFKGLIEDIRLQLASNYLEASNLSLMDIAFMLGYSELSSFIRAFRRWTKQTPQEFRDLHRAKPLTQKQS